MPVNMSYCRFENTLAAMRECVDSINDLGLDPFAHLSESEASAAKKLVRLCRQFAADYYGDL